jgi:hypothetical protein
MSELQSSFLLDCLEKVVIVSFVDKALFTLQHAS